MRIGSAEPCGVRVYFARNCSDQVGSAALIPPMDISRSPGCTPAPSAELPGTIYEGTSNMQLQTIAKQVLK